MARDSSCSPRMDDDSGNSSLPVVTTRPHAPTALCPVPPTTTQGVNSALTSTPMATSQHSSPGPSGPPTTGDMMDTSEPSTPQIPIHLTATPETAAQMHSPSLGGAKMTSATRSKHLQSGCPTPGSPLAGNLLEPTAPSIKPRVLVIRTASLPQELCAGIKEVCTHAPYRTVLLDDATELEQLITDRDVWYLSFCHDTALPLGELRVSVDSEPDYRQLVAVYHRPIEAFRALGRVLTAITAAADNVDLVSRLSFTEQAQFETLGTMIDCSRNGVLLVPRVFEFIRYSALLGINMVQLYTEDTYKIPDEPFFGYLRGPYTTSELSAIDDYAYTFGVEVVPCIQTLGHLGQILQWPRFANVRDTSEVLLSKYDETYALIEKMIDTITTPFRSRRIHIGMDEAHGVGEGRFRQIYGEEEGTKIFLDHLYRVAAICQKLNVRPMIWSDMLFCLAAKNNALYAYYDQTNNPATHEVMDKLPSDVDLVFWNYYHVEPEIYARKLQQHRELGCTQPWMAGGAWTWNRLWCSLPFTLESNQASLMVSKHPTEGVRHFMLTIWGDEGNECDFFSALPALAFVAHHGYTSASTVDVNLVRDSFKAICGGSYDDWVYASKLDEAPNPTPAVEFSKQLPPNLSKWLLWEDPFLSFLSPQYNGYDLEEHYRHLANYLFHHAGQQSQYPLNLRLQLPARLAQVLALKCHLRERLTQAYRLGNLFQLYQLTTERVENLIRHTRMLWQYHRALWMYMYKPYGWEVVELRYGGLITRLTTMRDRIMHYINCQNKPSVPLGLPGDVEMTERSSSSSGQALSGQNRDPLAVRGATPSDQLVSSGSAVTALPHPLAFGLDDPLNQNASLFPLPPTTTIPEFEEDLACVYEHAGTMLLLDYGRVTTPSRLG